VADDSAGSVVTVEQAARLLGVSHRTVLGWLRSGRLAGTRDADHHWHILRADVLRVRTLGRGHAPSA
jgi:excisionase family DNA binding protein